MDKFDRIYALHRMFTARRYPVSLQAMCDELECSASSVKRLLGEMKDILGAPIRSQRGVGYNYDRDVAFELPGVWFNTQEMLALLVMQRAVAGIGDGFLNEELGKFQHRLEKSLGRVSSSALKELARIRIPDFGRRSKELPLFPELTGALFERKRLRVVYNSRSQNESCEREISPQRLVYYKNNWYLDLWCHERQALRIFAVERMVSATVLTEAALDIDAEELDRKLTRSYGIFGGEPDAQAHLRFTARAARWAAEEEWFPDQEVKPLADGRYEILIPYGNPTELIMDICRYGPEVEVLAPASLRQAVADHLRKAANQYA
ncbi:helix-turn-helix transcriptional regulator [Mariprofundus erugo]|nr:WYL domain-containing protein [Mariprofundus erugo]